MREEAAQRQADRFTLQRRCKSDVMTPRTLISISILGLVIASTPIKPGLGQDGYIDSPQYMRGDGFPRQLEYTKPPHHARRDRVVEQAQPKSWRDAGKIDAALTDACRRQSFRLRRPLRFRAKFKDGILGVAFGHGLNLVDREGLADPAMTYYFRNANSTACIVLRTLNLDPRVQAAVEQSGAAGN